MQNSEHSQLLGINFFSTSFVEFQMAFDSIKAQYHSKDQKVRSSELHFAVSVFKELPCSDQHFSQFSYLFKIRLEISHEPKRNHL